ncbi:MAG TPA: hypothetical protein VOA64_18565 [Candidatus Dormibacteraeota bacterium]|nr:hypothetical protein [Candidatus Dormibacteraeota bacterium]
MLTTLKIPPPSRVESIVEDQWIEARSVFPIYLALARQLEFEIPFLPAQENLVTQPDAELFSQIQSWLDLMDQRVLVNQLRHLLQRTTLNASERGLCALIQRHLRKPGKTNTDRDKVDFLLVQYFVLCAPAKIYHKQIELSDVAEVLKPILGDVQPAILDWCEPLEAMIRALYGYRGLRELLARNFIEQGRRVKESAGGMFYDSAALVTFTRFNFLLRRTLIELMHADLIAIRTGLAQLAKAGLSSLDCQTFGLSAAEPLAKIRQIAEEWKQPFEQEYTEGSVNHAFESLLGLRSEVERALEVVTGKPANDLAVSIPPGDQIIAATVTAPPISEKARMSQAAPDNPIRAAVLDVDTCMDQIWEQLIATPPSRGRSMSTVKIGSTRVLLSSWEVAAFLSKDGAWADDLRRAVAARAVLTAVTESIKENRNTTATEEPFTAARIELSRLQERVEAAKRAKDIEAAVNLGISTKRLLSALDEAEKL